LNRLTGAESIDGLQNFFYMLYEYLSYAAVQHFYSPAATTGCNYFQGELSGKLLWDVLKRNDRSFCAPLNQKIISFINQ
jgi:hypothetical protein